MRSILYCPADTPKMMIQAPVYGADAVVFDLEDAIDIADKDQARILLSEVLLSGILHDPMLQGFPERLVRINGCQTDLWKDDLRLIMKAGVSHYRLPKVESAEQVRMITDYLEVQEAALELPIGSTRIQCIIETPLGVESAFAIGCASSRVSGLVFGAEDFCAATGIDRFGPVWALDYARGRIVNAAAACGLPAFDSVWSRIDDTAGLQEEAGRARDLGFQGKSVIHPGHIHAVNEIFTPSQSAITSAQRILRAYDRAGGSAIASDGRMVDRPVLLQALRVLEQAKVAGLMPDEVSHDVE